MNDRTTKQELIIERFFPIRISANPGRDCKEFSLSKTQSPFCASPNAMVPPNAILSAIDDEEFKNNLSEEEKAAFCEGLIPNYYFSGSIMETDVSHILVKHIFRRIS